MAQQELDGTDVGACFQQVRSEAVTKRVRSDGFSDATVAASEATGELYCSCVEGMIFALSRKEPGGRPFRFPVLAEQLEELGRKHDVAVLVTLSLADSDHHTFGIDVRDMEM